MTSPPNASRPLRPRRRKAPGGRGDGRRKPAQGRGYNVEALTDRTGAIVERYEYTPYGEPTVYTGKGADGKWYTSDDVTSTKSARGNDVLFQGRQIDWESGLYYYRARMYSPGMGRFISRDPLGAGAGDANHYRFVGNHPISSLDPQGLMEIDGLVEPNVDDIYDFLVLEKGAVPSNLGKKLLWQYLTTGGGYVLTSSDLAEISPIMIRFGDGAGFQEISRKCTSQGKGKCLEPFTIAETVPAGTGAPATLGRFLLSYTVQAKCGSNGDWSAAGTAVIRDTYDFDWRMWEFIKDRFSGSSNGRTWEGQWNTMQMSLLIGHSVTIYSPPLSFSFDSNRNVKLGGRTASYGR